MPGESENAAWPEYGGGVFNCRPGTAEGIPAPRA